MHNEAEDIRSKGESSRNTYLPNTRELDAYKKNKQQQRGDYK